MKLSNWTTRLSLALVVLSFSIYMIHYFLFRDANHILKYFIGDLAFLPIEVLLVTIILHRLLNERGKQVLLKKLNMVIGAFFSEVGTRLLKDFAIFDLNAEELAKELILTNKWSDQDYINAGSFIKNYNYIIKSRNGNLEHLCIFLIEKRVFLLRLLENPNLLEHDSFTELLWAVFHLTEELIARRNLTQLTDADFEHLSIDMKRAYILLLSEWLLYMKHLSKDYPYLFSLALRTNPFDPNASPEIK